jgi:hypothetical protein
MPAGKAQLMRTVRRAKKPPKEAGGRLTAMLSAGKHQKAGASSLSRSLRLAVLERTERLHRLEAGAEKAAGRRKLPLPLPKEEEALAAPLRARPTEASRVEEEEELPAAALRSSRSTTVVRLVHRLEL